MSQAPVGEIDSAGTLLTSTNPVPSMYYLFSLLDSQAGWAIGVLMLMGVFYAMGTKRTRSSTVAALRVLFFTLIAETGVLYFPMLVY